MTSLSVVFPCNENKNMVVVLGVGNSLLTDEGIGIHVIHYLREYHSDLTDVNYIDGGTLSFTLLPLIENTTGLIVIDAAHFHELPGTVRYFRGTEMDQFVAKMPISVHEVRLAELLAIARLIDQLPEQRAFIGVEPQTVDWGDFPSPVVASAIPQAAQLVLQILNEWSES